MELTEIYLVVMLLATDIFISACVCQTQPTNSLNRLPFQRSNNETQISAMAESINVCENSTTFEERVNMSYHRCYCDNYCFLYGDCCEDVYAGESESKIPENTKNLITNSSCKVDLFRLPNVSMSTTPGVMMVDTCVQRPWIEEDTNFDLFLQGHCMTDIYSPDELPTHFLTKISPVYDEESGFTYSNVFCALCSKANLHNLHFWTLYIVLEGCLNAADRIYENQPISLSQRIFHYISQRNCSHFKIPPDYGSVRHCIDKLNTNVTESRVSEACLSDRNSSSRNFTYDDRFCKMILDKQEKSQNQENISWTENYRGCLSKECFVEQDKRLTLYFQIYLKTKHNVQTTSAEEEYDEIPCPSQSNMGKASVCWVIEKYRNYRVRQTLQLLTYDKVSIDLIQTAMIALHHVLWQNNMSDISFENEAINIFHGSWDLDREKCILVEVSLTMKITGWMNKYGIEKLKHWVQYFDFRYDEENFITMEYFSFFRETERSRRKLPECSLRLSSRESIKPFSQDKAEQHFALSSMNIHLENLQGFCSGLIIRAQRILLVSENKVDQARQVLQINCTDDVIPEINDSDENNDVNSFFYITVTFSASVCFIALFYNLSKVEFSSVIGKSYVHMLICHAAALSCYLMCPSAEYFVISGNTVNFCIHYLWLCTFTWCTIMSYHIYKPSVKMSKKCYHGNTFQNRVSVGIGYIFPLLFLLPLIVYQFYGGHGVSWTKCRPSNTFVIPFAYGIPLGLCLILSGRWIILSSRKLGQFPNEEPWFSHRLFLILLLFFFAGLSITWAICLAAMILQISRIWKLYYVAEACNAFSICIGFFTGRRHIRALRPRKMMTDVNVL